MKRNSLERRERDVRRSIKNRLNPSGRKAATYGSKVGGDERATIGWNSIKSWIVSKQDKGLNATIDRKGGVEIFLPEKMNFSTEYYVTALHLQAIRKLSVLGKGSVHCRLSKVNFENLKSISTSAALVLTAELSRWDDHIRNRLVPLIDNWDKGILNRFFDLGFFELFQNNPLKDKSSEASAALHIVRYIKGNRTNTQHRKLKEEIIRVVGSPVDKWTFLHSGIDEAITNVTHHAYPASCEILPRDQNWYLTGSFNESKRELKIVFFDQGVGIPKSLPSSSVWERVLGALSVVPVADQKRDEVLLKAAMEISRTSTGAHDRGKGLPDMLEFIKQRKNGYLSVFSSRGLYKFSIKNGKESVKTERFSIPVCGTLIIWQTNL
jgi:hypothetical protein